MKKTILKIKTFLLLAVLSVSATNVFSQSTSLISACGDFTSGPSAWPYVLTATTVADGAAKSISSNIYNECDVSASWWSECESLQNNS